MNFIFHNNIWDVILPIDFHIVIFFKTVETTNQSWTWEKSMNNPHGNLWGHGKFVILGTWDFCILLS